MMGGLFAPLFGWFFRLVGKEALAEIQRKKAQKAAKAAKKKKAAKVAAKKKAKQQKLKLKIAKKKEEERLRKIKSERVQAELQAQFDRLTDDVAPPDPYSPSTDQGRNVALDLDDTDGKTATFNETPSHSER